MAIFNSRGLSGAIGPGVTKQYLGKTVVTSKPDMSRVIRNEKQKANSSKFKKAVAYAQEILYNPQKKHEYAKKLKKGQTVYHAAIREFMNRENEGV
jgi:hypothetical protein